VSAKPLIHSVAPVVTSAAVVEPVVTATSSQFVARNVGFSAPLVASPLAYSAYASPYVASPYLASPYSAYSAYAYPYVF
jgi:hypothetical protein